MNNLLDHEEVLSILNTLGISEGYSFKNNHDEPFFDYHYKFLSGALSNMKISFEKVDPSLLFISSNGSLNAGATKYQDYFLIKLNLGLLDLWKTWTEDVDENQQDAIQEWIGPAPFLDNEPTFLISQFPSLFTFYHEYAHLVQIAYAGNQNDNSEFSELVPAEPGPYIRTRHISEVDADAFAAISVGDHLNDYLIKHAGLKAVRSQKTCLLKLGYLSLLRYLFSFQSAGDPVYLRKGEHPHWLIRFMNISSGLIGYLSETWGVTYTQHEFQKIRNEAYYISKRIFENQFGPQDIQKFAALFAGFDVSTIDRYMQELNEANNSNPNSAVNIRNKSIRDQQMGTTSAA